MKTKPSEQSSSRFPFLRLRLLYAAHSVTSLAYEILWIKMIAPRLGMTQAAFGVVLGSFVTGLALGSFAAGRLISRRRISARALFVGCQAGLALWAWIFPWLLSFLDAQYVHVAPPLESPSHHVWRALIAIGILIPPAFAIGTAFPALSSWVERASESSGLNTARLYKDGLLWSALGAGLVPVALLATLGISRANFFLGGVNLLIALVAARADEFSGRPPARAPLVPATTRASMLVPLVALVLGAALFMTQISAAQFLWLTVNDTFYANALLVAEVLVFMGLGSLAYIRRPTRDALRTAGRALLVFSASLVMWLAFPKAISESYGLIQRLDWMAWPQLRFFGGHAVVIALVMAVPSFTAGWAFTAFCQWAVRSSGRQGDALGTVVAFNYLGSVGGSVLATFWLLPVLGLTVTLAGAALATGVSAIFLTMDRRSWARQRPLALVCGGIVVCSISLGLWGDVTFQRQAVPAFHRLVFHQEDASGITEVFEDEDTGDRRLYTSRLRMEGSNTPREMFVKRVQGALPVALHPEPRHILVIGLGTGVSLSAHLGDNVQRITCVEYSPGVIKAARLFSRSNADIVHHPKVRIIRQDGRNFARLTRETYDVIIQDLFFPYQTGTGSLYTREHYETLKSRLAPGGACGQWIPVHQMGIEEVKAVVRTFQSVFPDATAWLQGPFLFLSSQPGLDLAGIKERVRRHPSLHDLTSEQFLTLFLAGPATLSAWSAQAEINTDDNLLIERRAPLLSDELDSRALGDRNVRHLVALSESKNVFDLSRFDVVEAGVQQAAEFLRTNDVIKAGQMVHRILALDPDNREALFMKAQLDYEAKRVQAAMATYTRLFDLFPDYHQARRKFEDTQAELKLRR